MRKKSSKKSPRSEREVWDKQDVADHIACSLPHVLKMMQTQGLPFARLGKLVRFRREDVLSWHAAQIHAAQTQQREKGAA